MKGTGKREQLRQKVEKQRTEEEEMSAIDLKQGNKEQSRKQVKQKQSSKVGLAEKETIKKVQRIGEGKEEKLSERFNKRRQFYVRDC